MTQPVTFLDGKVTLYLGDVRAMLALIPSDSVDCVVTSPPYWGLRDYGVAGQLGLEPTLGEHLAAMVDVFREVRRVLKPEGTCWVNYGDCYATSPNGRSAADTKAAGNDDRTFRDKPFSTVGPIYDPNRSQVPQTKSHKGSAEIKGRIVAGGTLKAKDLCMVPNRLAIALQDDGWWIRSEIIWAKPNPMPESIRDRPATSHEKIFMLTKSARYFYDAAAVRQNLAEASVSRLSQDVEAQAGSLRANGGAKTNGTMKAVGGRRAKQDQTAAASAAAGGSSGRRMAGFNDRWDEKERQVKRARDEAGAAVPPGSRPQHLSKFEADNDRNYDGRNLRNYERAPIDVWEIGTAPFSDAHFATFPPELAARCIKAGCPKEGVVLDIFSGAGTTGLVAARLGRRAILIELNPEYADIAQKRIERDWMGEEERRAARTTQITPEDLPLFGGQVA